MDFIMYKRAIEYFSKVLDNAESLHKSETAENKPLCAGTPILYPFQRALPESVGVESARITAFLRELLSKKDAHLHLLMIMKDDAVILDYAKYPYRSDIWHVSHSLCKSITALAVGLAIEDGVLSLDDKLRDIFKKRPFNLDFARQNEVTVRHLLTMSAGIAFNEMGSVTYDDLVEGFFSASVRFTPGKKHMYNSINSYMLSAAIKERTGRDMFELLKERLFDPMGITDIYWEKCPRGITKGGWGLYMRIEDTLKFGKLFLDKGMWHGKRLISAEWLSDISKKQIDSSPAMCDYGYGYHMWQSVRKDSYQFFGMWGQNLIIFPDIRMVIMSHAGSGEFFPRSIFVSLVDKYFGDSFTPSQPYRPSLLAKYNLANEMKALGPHFTPFYKKNTHRSFLESLDGRRFETEPKKLSLLPVTISIIQRNFGCFVKSLRFETKGDEPAILFATADGVTRVPFDIYGKAKYFTLMSAGDLFAVASLVDITYNAHGHVLLRLTLCYPELTSIREFTILFGEKTVVRSTEAPDGKALLDSIFPLIDERLQDTMILKRFSGKADALFEQKLGPLYKIDSVLTELPK